MNFLIISRLFGLPIVPIVIPKTLAVKFLNLLLSISEYRNLSIQLTFGDTLGACSMIGSPISRKGDRYQIEGWISGLVYWQQQPQHIGCRSRHSLFLRISVNLHQNWVLKVPRNCLISWHADMCGSVSVTGLQKGITISLSRALDQNSYSNGVP